MQSKQRTLSGTCHFEGKGLHAGRYARMTVGPAPVGTGIRFLRSDIGPEAVIQARAAYVSSTARSTSISDGEVTVMTIEHLMSALTGMGIDNALVELDNIEVPILDGSANPYVRAFLETGIVEQDAPRHYLRLPHPVEVSDPETGSWIKAEPAEAPSFDLTIDFNSKVIGVQTAHWDEGVDYASEIGPCRTFVFFHELEFLLSQNLIKGGDVDNALVVVEHPVSEEQVKRVASVFNRPVMTVNPDGYLDNVKRHFPNECARHKLLDLIGDLRLAGGFINARVTGFKPGHTMNTRMAAALAEAIREQA
ncbi:MAG: UDP-3-O-acyl-N-acetylglucosamine deacetylase [Bacteroidales bacterium]|nr:UDP-3-O-acyl-N-acetylglucosamine deacetylase [Bacteroidales bacterium]